MVENQELKKNKIFLIEDDSEIRDLMELHLKRVHYDVQSFDSISKAQSELEKRNWDLLILDWMLPEKSGFDFLKENEDLALGKPILMVTAKGDPQNIVDALEAGAGDYLVKPFDHRVLLARVKALLRRSDSFFNVPSVETQSQNEIEEIKIDGMILNLKSHQVHVGEEEIFLTPSEFKLLHCLVQNLGRVMTRDQMIQKIQGEGVNVIGRTIDTHIFGLRKKLGFWGDHIETIRGIGYRAKETII